MAQFDLYIDTYQGVLVSGLTTPQSVPLPQFVQGDDPTLRIFLLKPTWNPLSAYTLEPIGGLSLLVAIGDQVGNATNYYTQQFGWTPSADPNNPNYFIGQLPMNTAPITTLLGSGKSADSVFQVCYTDANAGGAQTTVLEIPCNIKASVIKQGGVIVPAGQTPITLEYANSTFLTRTIKGGFYMVDPNTNKKFFVYISDGKTLQADEVS